MRLALLALFAPLFPMALWAQSVDLCHLPYRPLPSPAQVGDLFGYTGQAEGLVTTADSLVEITGTEEIESLGQDLPWIAPDTSTATILYSYGPMVARLVVRNRGRECQLALYGPPPFRTIQLEVRVSPQGPPDAIPP
jgi:hypothetical protein